MFRIDRAVGLAGAIITIVTGVMETVSLLSDSGKEELPENRDD